MVYVLAVLAASLVALWLVLRAFQEKDKGFQRERDSWRETERELLLRIQAPEQAVIQQVVADRVSPPAVMHDDDQGWWDAQLSKEELAKRLMAEEIA